VIDWQRLMLRSLLTTWLLCLPALVGAQSSLDLTLEVGEQRSLPAAGVQSYSEGLPGIVDVRLTKEGSFVVLAQRVGRTSLLLMMTDGSQVQHRIEVVDPVTRVVTPQVIAVAAADNVRLDFYFVQLSKDGSLRAGITWPTSFGGGSAEASFDLLSGTFSEATAMVTDQALPRLDLAQASGYAKLLRQTALIAVNGSEATFSGGGEVNIAVDSALGVGMRQISFGTQVRVRPRYDRESGRIELTVHAEVSDLASDRGSGIPGRVTSTLDSVVNLELGQSLVLAGLTATSEAESTTGLPGLSQIPILGALFGAHQSRREHTENLVFIVPSVVDAVSLDARERIRDALRAFSRWDGDGDAPLRPSPAATLAPARRSEGARP
jgi:pilus assembly protein CpaC